MKVIIGKKSKRKTRKYLGEIMFIIIGAAIMLFPLFVDMGDPAPVIGAVMVGFFLALIGAATLADGIIKEKKKNKALAEGKKFQAVVTAIQSKTRHNRRHMIHIYCAECEFTDPDTNEKYLCSSHYVTRNLYGTEGRTVTVYVDMSDRSNYYVDISELLQGD